MIRWQYWRHGRPCRATDFLGQLDRATSTERQNPSGTPTPVEIFRQQRIRHGSSAHYHDRAGSNGTDYNGGGRLLSLIRSLQSCRAGVRLGRCESGQIGQLLVGSPVRTVRKINSVACVNPVSVRFPLPPASPALIRICRARPASVGLSSRSAVGPPAGDPAAPTKEAIDVGGPILSQVFVLPGFV